MRPEHVSVPSPIKARCVSRQAGTQADKQDHADKQAGMNQTNRQTDRSGEGTSPKKNQAKKLVQGPHQKGAKQKRLGKGTPPKPKRN